MAEQGYRIERDSMGEVRVPADALYGAQTQRAVENFPVSGLRFPRAFLLIPIGTAACRGRVEQWLRRGLRYLQAATARRLQRLSSRLIPFEPLVR